MSVSCVDLNSVQHVSCVDFFQGRMNLSRNLEYVYFDIFYKKKFLDKKLILEFFK